MSYRARMITVLFAASALAQDEDNPWGRPAPAPAAPAPLAVAPVAPPAAPAQRDEGRARAIDLDAATWEAERRVRFDTWSSARRARDEAQARYDAAPDTVTAESLRLARYQLRHATSLRRGFWLDSHVFGGASLSLLSFRFPARVNLLPAGTSLDLVDESIDESGNTVREVTVSALADGAGVAMQFLPCKPYHTCGLSLAAVTFVGFDDLTSDPKGSWSVGPQLGFLDDLVAVGATVDLLNAGTDTGVLVDLADGPRDSFDVGNFAVFVSVNASLKSLSSLTSLSR